jgi:phage-related baseplate assembly protein
MDTPDFIQITADQVVAEYVNNYEQAYLDDTGIAKTIQPAQGEMLVGNSVAYLAYLVLRKIQGAALQNLTQFATYPVLDYRCQDFGVTRLPAQYAACTIEFTMAAGHGDRVLPAGMRIQSTDSLATFELSADLVVAAGVNVIRAAAVCDTAGIVGNGYVAGKINVILDPQPYLSSAVNVDTTSNGADLESDQNLRERLYLAPGAFSTAGCEDGYKYYARSASSLVLDVSVNNGAGGLVNLYPLVAGGLTSQVILDAVNTACSPKTVRPTNDEVHVYSPQAVNYNVDISIVAYASVADTTALITQSHSAVQALADGNSKKLGIDIIVSQFIIAAGVSGVAKVVVNSPAADIVLDDTQVGICTGVNVVLTGLNNDK